MGRKGQSAIEYLTTYGWMLIVIAVVAGAIFTTIQDSTQIEASSELTNADVQIENFGLTDNGLALELVASSSEPIEDVNVTIIDRVDEETTYTSDEVSLSSADTEDVSVPHVYRSEDTKELDVEIEYDKGGLEELETEGSITGRIDVKPPQEITGTVTLNPEIQGANVTAFENQKALDYDITDSNGSYKIEVPGNKDKVEMKVRANGDTNYNGKEIYAGSERTVDVRNEVDFNFTDSSEATVNGSTVQVAYRTEKGSSINKIANIEQFQAIRNHSLTGNYELIQDLNATQTQNWNNGKGFAKVGDCGGDNNCQDEEAQVFGGVLDGNNHKIRGFYMNRPQGQNIGIFTYVGGKIENLKLKSGVIKAGGDYSVGAVAAKSGGEINKVESTVNISGDGIEAGGLVGSTLDESLIQESFVTANVTGSDNTGGLVGFADGGEILRSGFSGEVDGQKRTGGLVGMFYGATNSIKSSYSQGSVNGTSKIGGLVGLTDPFGNQNTISNSYAASNVTGGSDLGGLVGENVDGNEVLDSYWDKDESGLSNGIGVNDGTVSGVKGLNSNEMIGDSASTEMSKLDFQEIWETRTNDYPVLYWEGN